MTELFNDLVHYNNWGGMLLVVVMAAFLLLSGFATVIIRRMSGRRVKVKRVRPYFAPDGLELLKNNSSFRQFAAPHLVPTPDWSLEDEERMEIARRRLPLPYPVPAHECCIDLERSRLTMLQDGSGTILAQCCVSGCKTVITLGRNISHMIVEEHHGAAAESGARS